MFVESESVRARFAGLAAEACEELFEAYGIVLSRTDSLPGPTSSPYLFAIISFVSHNLRGTCSLAASEPALLATLPGGGDVRDWIGELSNQLIGRMKCKLALLDVDIVITTPAVLKKARLQLPAASPEDGASVFNAPVGGAIVWLEVEVQPDFAFGECPDASWHEGDITLF